MKSYALNRFSPSSVNWYSLKVVRPPPAIQLTGEVGNFRRHLLTLPGRLLLRCLRRHRGRRSQQRSERDGDDE
jgi:hypothetical protein